MPENKTTIICTLLEQARIAGEVRQCETCKKDVRVTPATLKSVPVGTEIRFLCLVCGKFEFQDKDSDEMTMQKPTREQLEEIRQYLMGKKSDA